MAMGFSQNTFAFLQGLQGTNTKDWFDAQRKTFEDHVKAPAFSIIEALEPQFSSFDPPLKCEARVNGSLKRINRDVRFSKDKSPYNPRIHMVFWSGAHPNKSPAMHVVIGANSLGYGAGHFGVIPATLDRYRAAIMNENSRSELLNAAVIAKTVGCDMGIPDLKTLPRGYDVDASWSYLLRHKSFVTRTQQDLDLPSWVCGSEILDEISALTNACLPFIKWLVRHG